jgi:DNA-binding NarL/FixJ family response regulator
MIDSNSWEPIRILIVDDHPVVRHGLRNLLSIHPDFEIVGEAEDGAQVFPLLAANKTDVILLDIQMSGQGGIDVARRVLQSYPQSLVSKVMTNYQKLAQEQAKREAGLTADDLKILTLISEGANNKLIAEELFWSEATVKRRVQEILEKLEVSNRAQATAEAVRRGWI